MTRNVIVLSIEGEKKNKKRKSRGEIARNKIKKKRDIRKQEAEQHGMDIEDERYFVRICDLPFETTEADIRDFVGRLKT